METQLTLQKRETRYELRKKDMLWALFQLSQQM